MTAVLTTNALHPEGDDILTKLSTTSLFKANALSISTKPGLISKVNCIKPTLLDEFAPTIV